MPFSKHHTVRNSSEPVVEDKDRLGIEPQTTSLRGTSEDSYSFLLKSVSTVF